MEIHSISKAMEYEQYIERSRFIAHTLPTNDINTVEEFIQVISNKHRKANHNVYAYILGDDLAIQKSTDDGEPSGTAGMPILNILKTERITNIVVVVTRYFGGIKLGTGGLVRAYSGVAKTAIEQSIIKTLTLKNHYQITIPYNKLDNALFIINQIGNEYGINYTDEVTINFLLEESQYQILKNQLSNLFAGNINIKFIKQIYN